MSSETTRTEELPDWLSWVDPTRHRGIEIGALEKPLLPRSVMPVVYVDHAPTDELRRKYADDDAMKDRLDLIVDVDHVWSGDAPLADLLTTHGPVDVVVASHVVEHVPDLLGWLAEVESVLLEGGVLALAVPDMRFCFDANRDLTTMADVVDAHLSGLTKPSYRQIYDFHSRIVPVDAGEVWAGTSAHAGTWRIDLDPDDWAYELCLERRDADEYVDGHCQVFTPLSFVDLLERSSRLGLVGLAVRDLVPTSMGSLEFHVLLEKLPADLDPETRRARQLDGTQRAKAVVEHAAVPPGPGSTAPVPAGHRAVVVSDSEARLIELKRQALGLVRSARRRLADRRRR